MVPYWQPDFVWSFETGITTAQEPIDLKSASAFAILAGSTITNVSALSTVTGDVGLSPNPLTSLVAFPPGILYGAKFADGDADQAKSRFCTTPIPTPQAAQ